MCVAPREVARASFSGLEAVAWMAELGDRERESWMPAWETEEAAACQRIESPG